MKVFQVMNGRVHWLTPFNSIDETTGRFPPDCIFVEAPDYVNEQWGFDETKIGDERFIVPKMPEGYIYDMETGQMYHESLIPQFLQDEKNAKQMDNNNKLSEFLSAHPMLWVDGKKYGVSNEDQNEITMNLISYETARQAGVEVPLEWHASKEACVPWKYEDLIALSLAIRQYVYPWYNLNQVYKEIIYAEEDIKKVKEIRIEYMMKEDGTPYMPDELPEPEGEKWAMIDGDDPEGRTVWVDPPTREELIRTGREHITNANQHPQEPEDSAEGDEAPEGMAGETEAGEAPSEE